MSDSVNHPPHYNAHPSGLEAIELCEHMNFCLGNAVKYLWRAGMKDARAQDLRKAEWYLVRELDRRSRTEGPVAALVAWVRRLLGAREPSIADWGGHAQAVLWTDSQSVLSAVLLALLQDDVDAALASVRTAIEREKLS